MSSGAVIRGASGRLLANFLGRRPGRPLAAVLSKFATAVGTFLLQAVAARSLGADGLGAFALVYSVLLMIASLSNGLVGDSLTVLDRSKSHIRSAILLWGIVNSVSAGTVGAIFLMASCGLSSGEAVLFVLATTAFVAESAVRRLLQARLLFWSGVVIELIGGAASIAAVAIWAAVGPLSLHTFIIALGVGQLLATGAGWRFLPPSERRLEWSKPTAAMREVGAFGLWRAAQQGIRPGVLTVVRAVVAGLASAATLGRLEGARVIMSPALLMVQGISAYLFASYANSRQATMARLMRRADTATLTLSILTLLMGVVGTVLLPWIGPLFTGDKFQLSSVAVFGWAVYAAASAGVTPYQGLAAVRGRQATVTLLRCIDAALSLVFVTAAIVLGAPAAWVPFVLAGGSCIGGLLVRRYALRPIVEGERAHAGGSEPEPRMSGLESAT